MQWLAVTASPTLVASAGLDKLKQMEEQTWAAWPQPAEVAFIADSASGVPLGAVLLRVSERHGEHVVEYRLAIAVDSYARGRGVGGLLMQWARDFARASGAARLCLQ